MPLSLGELVTAAVSGGLGAKVLDWIHEEWRRRSGESRSARQIVDQHLDPILKSADELVGKIRSLAVKDFAELLSTPTKETEEDISFLSTVYLFGQFWCWLQILRRESVYVVLGSVENGRQIQSFMRALESVHVRLVRRDIQRGNGEALIDSGNNPRAVSLYEFVRRCSAAEQRELQKWLLPVKEALLGAHQPMRRQQILIYGAVVHAMLDTLDPKHTVARNRPGWGNKLTDKSRRELERRIFSVYLPFVKDPLKYTRPT